MRTKAKLVIDITNTMNNIFSHTCEKLDWPKISLIDPLQICNGEHGGKQKIEEVMRNIAFCSLEEEFGQELLTCSNINLRLFRVCRIAQLSIQCLLHQQVFQPLLVQYKLLFLLVGYELFENSDDGKK